VGMSDENKILTITDYYYNYYGNSLAQRSKVQNLDLQNFDYT